MNNRVSDSLVKIKSSAANPDLDWSQVKETVSLLRLAAAQVDFSMRDGEKSVNALTDSFTSMSETMALLEASTREVFEQHDVDSELKADVKQHCASIAEKTTQAIIAFQFYDKLTQRLDHVVDSLSKLSELVGDQGRLYSPQEWQTLQQLICSKYTMAEERELFEAIMRGEDVQLVMARMQALTDQMSSAEDDIELF